MARARKPKLAVWKFASCDGCQLTLLDCEDELLAVAGAVDIAYFPEATRSVVKGPYDVSLVEGSITTPHDAERIKAVRQQSRTLITIGACATAGGIQALRNFADVARLHRDRLCAAGLYIDTLATSTPIAAHVPVDFELRGCPIDKRQLLEVISAFLAGRQPVTPAHSVCIECKLRGNVCVHGRARRALPRAGDARRLRRDLSRLQSRLLRLLRPDGEPERRTPQRRARRARHGRTRRCAASTGPSTPAPSRSARRPNAMARKTIKVDYLARVEGEGALSVTIRDGRVTNAELSIFEPPRFFEAFLRGRAFSEVPDITARICGICPVAYQMSAVHAMEDALGVRISKPDPRPAPAALLRRVDREPRAAHLHAARAGFPRLRRRDRNGPRPCRRRASGASS